MIDLEASALKKAGNRPAWGLQALRWKSTDKPAGSPA